MLKTGRLILRPFAAGDAPEVQRLAGAREVALNTLNIPHPYPEGAAEAWIAKQGTTPEIVFAIEHDQQLIGAVGLVIERMHDRAELGYWIGVPFWGNGFATEAAKAIVRYGFEEQSLNRIVAQVFSRNVPSVRVLEKIGMTREGRMPQHFKKWGEYVDLECYGLLRPASA
jgi:[ribosomal protein S5]-alanine N-acetyltransferase